ncbi:MAG TPA: DUF420 domain-containing protein [Spirochaetes bacterium]|nr:DUF420 domain-containing protein [Spirochaetota bacterium]
MIEILPIVNATLNGISTVFILSGVFFIRQKKVKAHRICLLSAVGSSTLFLISYLTYHITKSEPTRFLGEGWLKILYFTILISHIILAAVIVPLVLITLMRAMGERFESHRKIARWTFPIWLYVSVTGVVIYIMLYPMKLGSTAY